MYWEIKITDEEFKECSKFADESSKTQREYRSGGTNFRSLSQIRSDTLRGKIAEVAVKKFLKQAPLSVKEVDLDFDIYPRGTWDRCDFNLNGKKVSVKSSKHFARYMLLETKDILRGEIFDCYILVLVDEKSRVAKIAGYALQDEIKTISEKTLDLKKGENIPETSVPLDADNRARKKDHLHNSEIEWVNFVKS